MEGDSVGESQHVTAKTSVWWDIENCQVPRNCDVHAIAQNISSALINLKYCGPVFISAYGDTHKIPNSVQQALSSTGITLNHVPAGAKDASDKKILVDMLFWAVDNPAPANYLLISGDRDFSNALHQLRMRRYNILLAQPQKASRPLVAAAKSVWLWTSLLAGGPPLSESESQTLLGNNSIASASNTAHTRVWVPDGFPVKLPVISSSETPHLGNQKKSPVAKGYDKYFTSCNSDVKTDEFINPTQGEDECVADYELRFIRLTKNCQDLVPTDEARCELFEKGLRIEIRERIHDLDLVDYQTILGSALRAEHLIRHTHEMKKIRALSAASNSRPAKKGKFSPGVQQSDKGGFSSRLGGGHLQVSKTHRGQRRARAVSTPGKKPVCPHCKRAHSGVCWGLICFNCGQFDHVKTNCPIMCQSASRAPVQAPNISAAPVQAPNTSAALVQAPNTSAAPVQAPNTSAAPVQSANASAAPIQSANASAAPVQSANASAAPVMAANASAGPVRAANASAAPVRAANASAAAVRAANASAARVRAANASAARVRAANASAARVRAANASAAPVRAANASAAPVRAANASGAPARAANASAAPVRAANASAASVKAGNASAASVRAANASAAPVRTATASAAPVRAANASAAPVRAANASAAPVRAANASAAPVRAAITSAAPVRAANTSAAPVQAANTSAAPVRAANTSAAPVQATNTSASPVQATNTSAAPAASVESVGG